MRFQHRRASRIPTCRCRRASAIRRTRAGSWSWRASTCDEQFGVAPVGLWPSEGSVSDEVFAIAAELGFQWAATDSGVLDRTWARGVGVEGLYRPYRWRQRRPRAGRDLPRPFPERPDRLRLFQDGRGARPRTISCTASARTARGILGSGRDALVPIILDGENAWEYYDRNGRPFLRELYRRISDDRAHARRHRERGAAR